MAASSPLRLYLDNNIYDRLVGPVTELVTSLAADGKAKFYSSHVTEDELMAMPPAKAGKQRTLMVIMGQLTEDVPSIPAVWDYGRLDRTLFGDEKSIAIYDSLKERHDPRDAIHVATANYVGCDYFVTEDKDLRVDIDRLQLKMKPLSFEEMETMLKGL